MRIFFNEFKKLLDWKVLLILFLFTVFFYFSAVKPFLALDGHSQTETYELGKRIAEKYGSSLDAQEQKEFENIDFPAIRQAANREIAKIPAFRDAKITTVDQFDELDEKDDKTVYKLFRAVDATIPAGPGHPDDFYLYWEAHHVVMPMIDNVRHPVHERIVSAPEGAARERAGVLEKRITSNGIPIIPYTLPDDWNTFLCSFSILTMLTAAALVSPYLIREYRSGIRGLTYTCRKGRPLFCIQFLAALSAAALVEAVQFAVFLLVIFSDPYLNFRQFFRCDFSCCWWLWWDMSFGQYIALNCAVLFLLSLGFAIVSFVVSKFCKNYVTVLAAQVPLVYLMNSLNQSVVGGMFNLFRPLQYQPVTGGPFSIFRPPYFEPLICALCTLLPLSLCLFLVYREKRKDILS